MRIKHGYDVGEVSIGWSVLNAETNEIIALGVRAWDKNENRSGNTASSIRREKRNARKTIRRKTHRKDRVKKLLVRKGIVSDGDILLLEKQKQIDIYELRYKAIKEDISNLELARLCIYFAGHRGFKSSDVRGQSDSGVIKKALSENRKLMKEKNYVTFGEMLFLDEKFKEQKKNKSGDYKVSVDRELVNEEVELILNKNCKNKEFIQEYIKILNSQRSFATGEDILDRVGYCTFEINEKRCAKATLSFQKFRVMQDLTKVKLINNSLESRYLTKEEKNILIQEIFNKGKLNYKVVRELLNINKDILFSNIDPKKESKENVVCISDYNKLKDAFLSSGLNISDFDEDIINSIANILTIYKTEDEVVEKLYELNLCKNLIDELKEINFTKFSHLSLTAIKKINIGLSEGMTYDKACEYVGYNFKNEVLDEYKQRRLPGFKKDRIINETVYKTCVEFRKVINALIDKYGSPESIHLESTRELGKTEKQRNNIRKGQEKNEKINKAIIKEIKELRGEEPTPSMIQRYKLYKEQNGVCVYSGKSFDLYTMLYDRNYAQIDHILPMSRSFDNSKNNKVLVMTSENQEKRNMTPYEYIGGNEYKWKMFEQRVLMSNLNKAKKQNLLNKTFSDKEKGFLNRNLNNTSWAIREISNHLKQTLIFEGNNKKKIYEINGKTTCEVRKLLRINKNREEDDLHHAVDAVIVALCDDKMVQACTKHFQRKELNKMKEAFKKPYENFEYDLEYKLKEIIVSRPEVKKRTGKLFDDTIYGYEGKDGKGKYILSKKKNIKELAFDKNGDFDMFDKENNEYTYNKIKSEILRNIKNENISKLSGGKLFEIKDKSNFESIVGENGVIIKRIKQKTIINGGNIKFIKNKNGGISVRIGGSIIRTDVYSKDGKFFCVPVYSSDISKPTKYIERDKSKEEWREVDDTFEFEFSLYKNSIIRVETKSGLEIFYYDSIHVGNASANIFYLNNKIKKGTKSFKTAKSVKKLKIDVLGNLIA